MVINRRHLLIGLASNAFLPSQAYALNKNAVALLSAGRDHEGYFAAGLTITGEKNFSIRLPDRGHDITVSPNGLTAVVFARRPGNFAVVIDLVKQRVIRTFSTPTDRHFYGHGVFSADGQFLYTTENDYNDERGVVGVYDVRNDFRCITEYSSGGIGPHEIILLSDKRTLAIANGGILTHPSFPRQKLNLPTIAPNLAYVNALQGTIVRAVGRPPFGGPL